MTCFIVLNTLLIFIVLVSISYVCSMIVEWIYKQGQRVISKILVATCCKRSKQKEQSFD